MSDHLLRCSVCLLPAGQFGLCMLHILLCRRSSSNLGPSAKHTIWDSNSRTTLCTCHVKTICSLQMQ